MSKPRIVFQTWPMVAKEAGSKKNWAPILYWELSNPSPEGEQVYIPVTPNGPIEDYDWFSPVSDWES